MIQVYSSSNGFWRFWEKYPRPPEPMKCFATVCEMVAIAMIFPVVVGAAVVAVVAVGGGGGDGSAAAAAAAAACLTVVVLLY